jgi:hypothetical protein
VELALGQLSSFPWVHFHRSPALGQRPGGRSATDFSASGRNAKIFIHLVLVFAEIRILVFPPFSFVYCKSTSFFFGDGFFAVLDAIIARHGRLSQNLQYMSNDFRREEM